MKRTDKIKKIIPVNEKELKLQHAQKLIAERDAEIIEACKKDFDIAMKDVLDKHGCKIHVQGSFQDNVIQTQIVISKR